MLSEKQEVIATYMSSGVARQQHSGSVSYFKTYGFFLSESPKACVLVIYRFLALALLSWFSLAAVK